MADTGEFGDGGEDRDSGESGWRLDVIAPTKEQANAVVKNFGQVVKEGKLFVHPNANSDSR